MRISYEEAFFLQKKNLAKSVTCGVIYMLIISRAPFQYCAGSESGENSKTVNLP